MSFQLLCVVLPLSLSGRARLRRPLGPYRALIYVSWRPRDAAGGGFRLTVHQFRNLQAPFELSSLHHLHQPSVLIALIVSLSSFQWTAARASTKEGASVIMDWSSSNRFQRSYCKQASLGREELESSNGASTVYWASCHQKQRYSELVNNDGASREKDFHLHYQLCL